MRIALDTTILAGAEGIGSALSREAAIDLLERLPPDTALIPVQVLGELFTMLVRAGRTRERARSALLEWRDHFGLIETTPVVMLKAVDIVMIHDLRFWDAIIVAAAATADCRFLLSQGIADGLTWNGVSVADPFAPKMSSALERLLAPRA